METFRRIMVATDGSDVSLKAARAAVTLAMRLGPDLLVAHVVDDEVVKEISRALARDEKSARQIMCEKAERYLAEVQNIAKQNSVAAVGRIEYGAPHEVLLRIAERENRDLLVMGKTGRRGLRRALAGSVTRRVIDLAEIPILVVK